jgi:hypothetical protein
MLFLTFAVVAGSAHIQIQGRTLERFPQMLAKEQKNIITP